MKNYKFSPVESKDGLMMAITYIHFSCFQLCKQFVGRYLPNTGIVGVFCHYDDEYERLLEIQTKLVDKSQSINGKYFLLHEPIIIPAKGDVPTTTYTHLYIRKADPYRHHVGDADFYLESEEYIELKNSLLNGKLIKGARLYYKPESNMVELYDPDVDALAYVYSKNNHTG